MLEVGNFIEFDAGEGQDRWKILDINGDTVYLSNTCGATTYTSLENLQG